MRKFTIATVVLVGLAALSLLAYQRSREPYTPQSLFETFARRGVKMDGQSRFHGAVRVVKDGEVLLRAAYGYADGELTQPLTPESRFLVGAGAKPFTAALVLRQVERGAFALDTAVADLLPDAPEDPAARITVHQLLTHTSGLPRDARSWDGLRLNAEPGEGYAFSNFGYAVLIDLLEAASGRGYAELLQEDLVAPLGLTGTGWADGETLWEHAAPGRRYDAAPLPLAMLGGGFEEIDPPSGGGVYTTVDDLHRVADALRDGSLLSAKLQAEVWTPRADGSGYGWFRNREWVLDRHSTAQLWTHVGYLGGHSALVALYDDGTEVVVLSNVGPLDLDDVLDETWLAAHGTREFPADEFPEPSLRNARRFNEEGGLPAFLAHWEARSERAGRPVAPGSDAIERVVRLLLNDGDTDGAIDFVREAPDAWLTPRENTLNAIGYLMLLEAGRPDAAREVFERNARLFPDSPNVHDSLGEALQALGEIEAARAAYTRALELGEKQGDRSVEFYRSRLRDLEP